MTRSRVDDRAHVIYAFLKEDGNFKKPFRGTNLLRCVGLEDNATNRAALKRLKYMAEVENLCCPYPVAANGYTYTLTDDPTAAFDPALHLARGQAGLEVPKVVYEDFLKSRLSKLPKDEREVAKAWMDFEDKVRAVNAGAADLTKVIVAMRRDMRRPSDDDAA